MFAGAYSMVPDLSLTMQRSVGLEQAVRLGGGSRALLNQSLTQGLQNAMSSRGSDAPTAAILAARGYGPTDRNYGMMVGQIAGAYRYLGIDNAAAANAITSMQGPRTSAGLYGLGISTYDVSTGKFKTQNQIARELLNVASGGRPVTQEDIQFGLQSGSLSSILSDIYGEGTAEYNIMLSEMMNVAGGKKGGITELGNTDPIPALAAAGQMSYAETRTMQTVEKNMIEGFQKAAIVVDETNKAFDDLLKPMAELKGLIGGVGGTNVGEAIASAAPLIASGIGDIIKNFNPETIMTMLAGTAAALSTTVPALVGIVAAASAGAPKPSSGPKPQGGSSPGYGASFNAQRLGGKGGGMYAAPQGMITAMFGAQDSSLWSGSGGTHTGTDIAMPIGTPVEAAMDGQVISTDAGPDYGTSLVIDHGNGYQTVYAHLSERLVKAGDRVTKGQRIAKSGDTGNTTGPHLHYEVRFGDNNPVDPSSLPDSGMTGFSTNLYPVRESVSKQLSNYAPSDSSTVYSSVKGTGSQKVWATQLLQKLGAPTSDSNISALITWARYEGGHWNNSASYNPLNTTFDMGGNKSINRVGVKQYGSWDEGLSATVKTLLGNRASERGYAAIVEALRSDSGVNAVLGAVNRSAWVNGEGRASNYNFPRSRGGGAPMSATSGDARTVNITVTFNQADEASAVKFARQVQSYLDRENNNLLIGSN